MLLSGLLGFMSVGGVTLCGLCVDSSLGVQSLQITMAALQMLLQCAVLFVAAITVAALERFSHRRRRN